jgi:serine/threonine-protein kinase
MAPEQAAGEAIDVRVDLYAVGAMMFEMLTGHPPFDGDSLASVLHKHMFAELPALPEWLPVSIAAVIRTLMAKRAADRPATAASAAWMLRDAVERIASQPTVVPHVLTIGDLYIDTARPASMLKSSQKQGRIFGGVLAAAAAVLLAFGVPRLFAADDEPAKIVATDAAATFAATADAVAVKPITGTSTSTTTPTTTPSTTAVNVPAPRAPVVAVTTPEKPVGTSADAPRSSGGSSVHKPAAKPRTKPRVDTSTPAPTGPRKIEPSKPPRASHSSKLPSSSGSGSLSREGGKLHLRPSHA